MSVKLTRALVLWLGFAACDERTYLILERRPPQPRSLASIVVAVRANGGDSVKVWVEGGKIIEQPDARPIGCYAMPIDGPRVLSIMTGQDEIIVHAELYADIDCGDGELLRSEVLPMRLGEDEIAAGGASGAAGASSSDTTTTDASSASDASSTSEAVSDTSSGLSRSGGGGS